MFGWLFGKKKRKPPKRLYGHDELSAEFFAMWPVDQHVVLRALEVPKPAATLDYAKPTVGVRALTDWKRDQQAPMSSDRFLEELHNYLDAGRKDRVRAVFQQIFRDLEETEEYMTILQKIHDETCWK